LHRYIEQHPHNPQSSGILINQWLFSQHIKSPQKNLNDIKGLKDAKTPNLEFIRFLKIRGFEVLNKQDE
jgi:hypothetical protein